MTELKFDRTISLGNIMSMGTAVISVLAAYFILIGRMDMAEYNNTLIERRLVVTETQLQTLRDAYTDDRLTSTTMLTQMQSDIKYLREAVDEVKTEVVP